MRKISFTCLAAIFTIFYWCAVTPALEIRSPNNQVMLSFDLKERGQAKGCPVYSVTYQNKKVLLDSWLGLELESGKFFEGLTVIKETPSKHDDTWQPVCGEREKVRDNYNQVIVELKEAKAPHRTFQIIFRVYDEGVAFRYKLPAGAEKKEFTILKENSRFTFTGDHTTWAVYAAQGNYAGGEVPLSKVKPGVERPLTVRIAEDLYASLSEAGLVDYARMKFQLARDQQNTMEALLDGTKGKKGPVSGTLPFTTPWRVVMVADSPGKLLEQNDIILNLNEPCALQDTSWIKPGKVIREVTLTTAGGKACVDFCVQQGLQYIEYDAGWYGFEYDPKSDARDVHLDPKRNPVPNSLDLQEVIRYASSKGIGVILYVNHLALEKQLAELLKIYQAWGIKGIKFGFVNVGSQHWTRWLHEAIKEAAKHKLMVDVHDEFRSMGFQRTYPNLMTVEGILGNEGFPPAVHNATLPFTRFLTGPGDYTYCWYSSRLKMTPTHQLALSTIYYSPWQFLYWYDRPAMYKGEKELEYWKHLPTTWDETRVIKGEIGRYASVARRKGPEWYVGTIHPAGREKMDIPLSFLSPDTKYKATIYSDAQPDNPTSRAVRIETLQVDRTTVFQADMPANGGQAIRIVPEK